ncbi:MAG: hypothetical protein Q9167_001182 [Letrouitia subvulpina]
MRRLTKGEYEIKILPAIYLSFERHLSLFASVCALAWIVWLVYMVSQFCWIWSLSVDEKSSKLALWTVAFAEFCLTFQDLVLAINHFVGLMALRKRTQRARYHLMGQRAPSVDIFITCCGEATDVVVDTVHAAMAQDYPPDQFRVFVLDDGGSKDLKSIIEDIRSSTNKQDAPTIEYLSRELKPGTRSFFKAGNINFGIRESANRGPSEFTAGLDADMIPDSNWLRRMIPEHILNDSLGITVCPQQTFTDKEMRADMAFRCLASLLPASINVPTFVVCGSIPASERSRRYRLSFWARVLNGHMLMFVAYLLYGSIPLIQLIIGNHHGHIKDRLLLPGPWVKLVGALLKVIVPIWYFVWPPDMPERRVLLEIESDGVRRPKAENKKNDRGEFLWWACVAGIEILTISLTKTH